MAVTTRALGTLRRPEMRRRALVMADQAASALSNTLVAVLVARSTSPAEFGAFSLVNVTAFLAMGAIRSVVGEPLLSLYSNEPAEVRRGVMANLHATTLFLGALIAGLIAVATPAVGGLSGSGLLALAIVLPLILFQDTWRFAFIVDRPGAALAIDLVWLVGVMVAMPLAPSDAGVTWYVLVWGITGGLGGLVGMVLGGRLPGRPHPFTWLVKHRDLSWRYFGEFVTAGASSQLVLTSLGVIAGLAALGSAKASFVFYGLLNTLHAGIYLAAVPEGTRKRDRPAALRRMFVAVSIGLAAMAVVWMVAGLAMPDRIGRGLFGATWEDTRDLMVPMGLAMVLGGVTSGGMLGLRALADARRSFHARMRSTVCVVVCPLVGALVGDAYGFALGLALGRVAGAAIWWDAFGRGLRDSARGVRARLLEDLRVGDAEGSRIPAGGEVLA